MKSFFCRPFPSVKKKFPDSKITLCLEPRSKGIKELCPNLINEVFTVEIKNGNKSKNALKLIRFMISKRFDTVISSGTNKFIPVMLFFSGAKIKIGYNSGKLSKMFLTEAVNLNKKQYAADMYHDLVKNLTGLEHQLPKI